MAVSVAALRTTPQGMREIASGGYNLNADVSLGDLWGCSASRFGAGIVSITLDAPATSTDNIRVFCSGLTAFVNFTAEPTIIDTSTVRILVVDTADTAFDSTLVSWVIYDAG